MVSIIILPVAGGKFSKGGKYFHGFAKLPVKLNY